MNKEDNESIYMRYNSIYQWNLNDEIDILEHDIIMAAGCFISGSSIELSADGPLREPYTVYFQGGLTYFHSKFGVMMSLQQLIDDGLFDIRKLS